MKKWYAVRKRGDKRWKAYELKDAPKVKRGYELRGPFNSLLQALIAVNQENPCSQK